MLEILTIIAVSAGAFIGTNLDNLVLLVALHTRYQDHPAIVSAGYITGMVLILGICLLIGEIGELIPLGYLGLLGIIPITTGCLALVRLFDKIQPAGNKHQCRYRRHGQHCFYYAVDHPIEQQQRHHHRIFCVTG